MFGFFSKFSKAKKYTLVISGWWTRWFYALGILKWLEDLWLDKNIENIYWVSAGGIAASYRAAWYSADQIFDLFIDFWLTSSLNLLPKKSIFKHDKLIKKFKTELPDTFEKLGKKIFLGCTDAKTAKYIVFDKWNLLEPLLGTLSIPWAFLPVEYGEYSLMDGWVINNFPVDIAKKNNPKNKIIWVFLNYFEHNQKINTLYDSLRIAFDILLRSHSLKQMKLVDHLFYKKIPLWTLELNKKKMTEMFNTWYKDCINYFKNKK